MIETQRLDAITHDSSAATGRRSLDADVRVEQFVTDRGDAGQRLDLVLRRHLAGALPATRTEVQRWITDGCVRVNARAVRRVAWRTAAGDAIEVALPDVARRFVMEPEAIPLDILHEDADLMVVNKPAGVVVHPTYGHQTGTIMNGLLLLAQQWPDDRRPSIVGRLDKQTSGLVLVAKCAGVHAALQRTLTHRDSTKDYLAVVYGRPPAEEIDIDLKLARDPNDRRRVVATEDGAAARTLVRRIAERRCEQRWLTLLRCRLITGRMHQIRVHLSASGWPIVGDGKYGEPFHGMNRQALHAWRLGVAHPTTGRRLEVEAPFAADFKAMLDEHFSGVSLAAIP